MLVNRRLLLRCLSAGVVGAASARASASGWSATQGSKSMPVEFPSFELQASTSALQQLTSSIEGWRVERIGNSVSNIWLRTVDGATWLLGVDQHDVRPMFEVFTLGMLSMSELQERWESRTPPPLPKEVLEPLRKLITTRPPAPVAPTDFEPWPLHKWRTDIVRRAEFIVEGAEAGPTFGNNPNSQSASRPGAVPPEASAFCEVAVGVLFTSGKPQPSARRRLDADEYAGLAG